jgi:Family of unknown function (DUF5681)
MPTTLWQPGQSGNPAGRTRGSRNKLSEEIICALLRDFRQHGQKAVARVRQTQPAAYLKICALLVPREMQLEHKGGIKEMSDEQLETAIEMLTAIVDQKLGESAKVIEGKAEPAPGSRRKAKRLADLTLTEPSDNGDMAHPKGSERTGPRQDMVATVNPSKSP